MAYNLLSEAIKLPGSQIYSEMSAITHGQGPGVNIFVKGSDFVPGSLIARGVQLEISRDLLLGYAAPLVSCTLYVFEALIGDFQPNAGAQHKWRAANTRMEQMWKSDPWTLPRLKSSAPAIPWRGRSAERLGRLSGAWERAKNSQNAGIEWVRGDLEPTQPAQQRLRFAYGVIQEIETAQSKRVAQAWALSINPRLGFESPIKAIREDRFQETAAAAQALLEDACDG
ncbi:hypothetical protein [Specibacter cremeus]|uniref:hypothetical protein n=1 Tax=Specibacter cremeus TaxID=1629051 RepID=UPI000F7B7609|nr:hypothetical protein [Specibacter cremeus]